MQVVTQPVAADIIESADIDSIMGLEIPQLQDLSDIEIPIDPTTPPPQTY